MLNLNLFQYAAQLTYYFTVEESGRDKWLCAHREAAQTVARWKIYAVDGERVPDLGTMPRVTNPQDLPPTLCRALGNRLGNQSWRLAPRPADLSRSGLDDIKEAWRKVAAGENPKGGFLTAFAEAISKADSDNLRRLAPVALEIAEIYGIK
jgi:hypothetical protein